MVFQEKDNVTVDFYGTTYAGIVAAVVGDADNPTEYKVEVRARLAKNKQGKDEFVPATQKTPLPCPPGLVKANPSGVPAGFVSS